MGPENIIVALDLPDVDSALKVAKAVSGLVGMVKIGPELWIHGGEGIVGPLADLGFRVFLDLKFHDIPSTVYRACRAVGSIEGVSMLTVHTMGGAAMLQAAMEGVRAQSKRGAPKVLGVTVLTSLDADHISILGIDRPIERLVKNLTQLAWEAELDGVVASAKEASAIRKSCGEDFLIVTPAIRLEEGEVQDQKRVSTPLEAIEAGANYIVIGRPVFEAESPRRVVEKILKGVGRGLD